MESIEPANHASTLKRLIAYTFEYKCTIAQALFLVVLSTGADVLGPILIKIFIDDYLMENRWIFQELLLLVGIYIAANLSAAYLGFWQTVKLSDIAQRVVFRIRESIFAHVLTLPIRRFDFTPVGSVVSRITNDTETVKEMFVGVLGVYLQSIVKVIGIFVAMAFLDIKLMLICAIFVPLVALLMVIYRKLSTPVFNRARSLLSDINGSLNESLQGINIIQLFHQEKRFANKFSELNENYFKTRTKTMQLDALLLRPMVDLLQLVTLAGLIWGFGLASLDNTVEIGILYAFVNYLGRFVEPLIEMTQRLNLFQQAMVSAARVFQWLDEDSDHLATQANERPENLKLELKNLTFSYDQINPAVKQIDLVVDEGQFVGIVGHTGSGKSTLASLLMGFYRPDSGEVLVGGKSLSSIPLPVQRENMVIVQQDPFIFKGSIRENITVGRPVSESMLNQAICDVGLDAYVSSLPNALDHELSEKGSNLSYGQRQMISLARALVGNPGILILDEATANVDSATESVVQNAIQRLRGKRTIIAIAHRLSTITQADRIIVMHQGEIRQQGMHKDLMSVEGLYKHMYELQRLEV